MPHSMWDLISLTRDGTRAPWSRTAGVLTTGPPGKSPEETITNPLWWVRKLRCIKIKQMAPDHTDSKRQSQDSNPSGSESGDPRVFSALPYVAFCVVLSAWKALVSSLSSTYCLGITAQPCKPFTITPPGTMAPCPESPCLPCAKPLQQGPDCRDRSRDFCMPHKEAPGSLNEK